MPLSLLPPAALIPAVAADADGNVSAVAIADLSPGYAPAEFSAPPGL